MIETHVCISCGSELVAESGHPECDGWYVVDRMPPDAGELISFCVCNDPDCQRDLDSGALTWNGRVVEK